MLALQNFISEAVKASPEASLVWAGVCLVLPLLTQPAIADEAQRNGFSYVTSRIGFWATLERQLANAGNWTESVQGEFITLYQHLFEFQVRTVLRYDQRGFARFVQDLSSNVWAQLITAIKDQERLLHQDLQQYHNAYQSLTFDVLKQNSNKSLESNAKFLEALQEVQDFVRKGAEDKLKEKEKKCLRLFRLTDNQRDVSYEWYKSRVEKRVEGTCVWAVEHENFRDWLELKSGPLLITADPGCGKSVLSKYLIDLYLPQRCPTATVCYFFFKDGDQNTVKQALCALLHQLFCQKPNLINYAMEEYERNGEGMVGMTSALWGVFNNAICDENAGTIIIVLDALDECEPNEFTLLVHNLIKAGGSDVKFLFTSRPCGDVLSPFKYGDMLERFPRVLIPGEKEDQSDQISTEINRVIQVRVDQFVLKYQLQGQLKNTLWAELNKTKHRTYLWVYLVFDHLETLVSSEALKRTAQGFKTAIEKLPRTVEDAYERILNRPQGALRTTLRRVLCVILAAQRPLSLSEMQIVVNMEPDMKSTNELDLEEEGDFSNRLRTICGLFVSVHQRNVYFLHQTAREFLQAETELSTAPGSWRSSITNCQAHAELARACAQYIYILGEEPFPADDWAHTHLLAIYQPFLDYSARFWGKHSWVADAALENDPAFLTAAKEICNPDTKGLSRWWMGFHEQRGADVNVVDFHGTTSLHGVAKANTPNVEVARLLIDHHAHVDATTKDDLQTPLHCYIDSYRDQTKWDFPGLLIANGANIEARDHRRCTALHFAAERLNIEMARLLVEKGSDIEATDQRGWTALHFAAHITNGMEMASLLLEKGANIEAVDQRGWTALHFAANKLNVEVTKYLVKKGANVNATTPSDRSTPLLITVGCPEAFTYHREGLLPLVCDMARLLLEGGADINAKEINGEGALHKAIKSSSKMAHTVEKFKDRPKIPTVCKLLVEKGADVEARD
ncbi:hypothetical protein N0V85_004879 [Neurospora sp. IMI 360204]|nr:hypothetical protein N0V85_004879 [Neurospora sp. IMI 360204]